MIVKNNQKTTQIQRKMHQKSYQFFHRFLAPKCTENEPKMEGKKVGKFHFGRLGRPMGPPRGRQRRQRSPRAPKMKPKGAPDPQNGAQEEPRDTKMVPKRPPKLPKWSPRAPRQAPKMCARSHHDRTNIQTDAKTSTQQPSTQTT